MLFILSSPEFFSHLYENYLELLLDRRSISTSLVRLGIYLVSLFGICPSIASFCLLCCFYFYVSCKLLSFPVLEKEMWDFSFVRDVLGIQVLLSNHQSYMLSEYPIYRLHGSFYSGWLIIVDIMVGMIGSLVWLVARPCLFWRLLAVSWKGHEKASYGIMVGARASTISMIDRASF